MFCQYVESFIELYAALKYIQWLILGVASEWGDNCSNETILTTNGSLRQVYGRS